MPEYFRKLMASGQFFEVRTSFCIYALEWQCLRSQIIPKRTHILPWILCVSEGNCILHRKFRAKREIVFQKKYNQKEECWVFFGYVKPRRNLSKTLSLFLLQNYRLSKKISRNSHNHPIIRKNQESRFLKKSVKNTGQYSQNLPACHHFCEILQIMK